MRMLWAGDLTVTHSSLFVTIIWLLLAGRSCVDGTARCAQGTEDVRSPYVVNVHIVRPDIDTVKSTVIATANEHVVDLAVLACVHAKVEGWTVHKLDVVDAEGRLCPSVPHQPVLRSPQLTTS